MTRIGEIVRTDGGDSQCFGCSQERDFHVAGAILGSAGNELTTAVATLRKLRTDRGRREVT